MDIEKTKFCRSCGEKIAEEAEICPKCGCRQEVIVQLKTMAPVLTEGEKKAKVSMILGIIACSLAITGYGCIASFVLGIIGLVFANKAKELNCLNGHRKAGFVLSLISIILGAIAFTTCIVFTAVISSFVDEFVNIINETL